MGKPKPAHKVVFRAQRLSAKSPRLGIPDTVQPGDWLTFYDGDKLITRVVGSVHKKHVLTEALPGDHGTLDGPHRVKPEDFYEASRPPEEIGPAPENAPKADPPQGKTPTPTTPKSKKKRQPEKNTPKPRAKKAAKAKEGPKRATRRKRRGKKKPPPEWLDFLSAEYRQGDKT